MNIAINLSTAVDTAHQGIWMENGSGGFLGDLIINGGKYGIFTVRNVTISNAQTANFGSRNWGWTFQGVNINNCGTVGAEAIIDATVTDTPIFVRPGTHRRWIAGSEQHQVGQRPGRCRSHRWRRCGTTTITSWGQTNIHRGSGASGTFTQGTITAPPRLAVLLDSGRKIFGKSRPQYAAYAVSEFVSVRNQGVKGDGNTNDTAALKAIFATSSLAQPHTVCLFFDRNMCRYAGPDASHWHRIMQADAPLRGNLLRTCPAAWKFAVYRPAHQIYTTPRQGSGGTRRLRLLVPDALSSTRKGAGTPLRLPAAPCWVTPGRI
ncbi:hypothetical protein DFH08DRAFT_821361 [Mycena albidolilacea]|uniref:Rhamnogalacturonase A/B/Epimerase-like pectate lyase domain-containing protein n=1 Tax=Mycena albidolilacea TaxID=1033008 RepID=A0AAD6ZAR9_9AGAR|nr:hypothetical protein DFH08DRAFT_821361 [Mycena albidolilacea]